MENIPSEYLNEKKEKLLIPKPLSPINNKIKIIKDDFLTSKTEYKEINNSLIKNNSTEKTKNLEFKEETIQNESINKINSIIEKITTIPNLKNYSDYKKEISKLTNEKLKKSNTTEFQFQNLLSNKEKTIEESEIEKIKKIGKIGLNKTFLDITTANSKNIILSNNNCSIFSKEDFQSIKTNNCIFKGKWCYEVLLITNGSFQIGFSQYNSIFTQINGIGNDLLSFSFDGSKKLSLHKNKFSYGNIWDCGDIIGVCIDLDNKLLEYYLNGKKLGICFENIPVGENIVYYPSITINKNEKCVFNFGQYNFQYNYYGYKIFDFNINWSVSIKFFDLLKNDLVGYLNQDLSFYEKILIFYQIFDYLIHISFNDPFIFKKYGIPFLNDLYHKDQNLLKVFLDNLIDFIPEKKDKVKFVYFIVDNITSLIEENSVLGKKGIPNWIENIKLFQAILLSDNIVNYWFENDVMYTLKTIFNSNYFKFTDFYNNIMVNKNLKMNVLKAIKVINNNYFEKKKSNFLYINNVYCEHIANFIKYLLTEQRKFSNDKILKDQFNEFLRIELKPTNEDLLNFLQNDEKITKNQSVIYKNVFYPLFHIFVREYINIPFEKLSTEPFFIRDNNLSIYQNDINLGGTINNVTKDYFNTIDKKDIIKNNEFYADFFHKIIRMGYEHFLLPIRRKLEKFITKNKNITLDKCIIDNEKGSENFDQIFKRYFNLFSYHSQILFYNFSFYVTKYILYLKNQNKNILYFLPVNFIEFPFSLFQILRRTHCKILIDQNLRNEINQSSIYFVNDDYIESILELYLYLFSDENIKNPSIKESLISKVFFFIEISYFEIYEKKNHLFDYLIKGLLNNLKNDCLSILSCKVLLKLISPICFANEEINIKPNIKMVENYFKNINSILNDFLISHFKYLNKIMTQYLYHLSDLMEKLGKNIKQNIPRKYIYLQQLSIYYNLMCDLLKLTEFFIYINPNSFLLTDSLIYYNFIDILKNLNYRILDKKHIDYLIKLANELNFHPKESSKKTIYIKNLGYSIIGIFLKINSNKDNINYNNFINKFSNISDLEFDSFLNLVDIMKIEILIPIPEKKIGLNTYNDFILNLINLRKNIGFTNEEIDKFIEKGILCIICYNKIANIKLIPCKHISCEECYIKYKKEKNICFICHSLIEKEEKIENNINEND